MHCLQQDGASIRGNTLKYSMNKGDIVAEGTPNKYGFIVRSCTNCDSTIKH